jgi:hypothetical protein
MRRALGNIREWIFAALYAIIPIVVVGMFLYFAVTTIISSISSMQFESTHPITRARVLSVFTHTYTDSQYDPVSSTYTSTTETETCAQRISFRANGQDIHVDVSQMLECPLQVGDQPKIAYDPRHPAHLQFVSGGDPFWGNILQMIMAVAFAGFAVVVGMAFIRFPSERGFRGAVIFWTIGVACIIALIVISAINHNP